MSVTQQKRLLALAGMIQAAHLVVGSAKNGLIAQDSLLNSLNSIFVLNPESISDVYRGTEDIQTGLRLLNDLLNNIDLNKHGDIIRYVLALISLERNLAKRQDMGDLLAKRIPQIDKQRAFESNDIWIASLADLYAESLGQLAPRIQVTGKQQLLQNPQNIQRIRALLLSGLRSAVLWQQLGGRRWHFLFSKSEMKRELKNIL